MNARTFLVLMAAVFVPYGLFCFFAPGALDGIAGVSATTATGSTELRAMYGGLQTGIGLLALLGARRPEFVRPALAALAFAGGGLFFGRITGAALEWGWSFYTGIALALEITILTVSVVLLRRESSGAPA